MFHEIAFLFNLVCFDLVTFLVFSPPMLWHLIYVVLVYYAIFNIIYYQ